MPEDDLTCRQEKEQARKVDEIQPKGPPSRSGVETYDGGDKIQTVYPSSTPYPPPYDPEPPGEANELGEVDK